MKKVFHPKRQVDDGLKKIVFKASCAIKRKMSTYCSLILVGIIAAILMFPIYTTIVNSIMDSKELTTYTEDAASDDGFIIPKLMPEKITFKQYSSILLESHKFYASFWKSCKYSFLTAVGQVIVGTMAGFVFSRFIFKGRDTLFFIIIASMMMPFQVTMVPNFIALRMLGILNTDAAIILPGVFSAFGIFLMRQFMVKIPDSLIDAAKVDGADTYVLFFKIVIPICENAIAALIVLCFIDTWNMIEQPLVFLNSLDKMPLSIIIREAMERASETVFAPSVLYMLPAVIVFFIFEESLVEGIEASQIRI